MTNDFTMPPQTEPFLEKVRQDIAAADSNKALKAIMNQCSDWAVESRNDPELSDGFIRLAAYAEQKLYG